MCTEKWQICPSDTHANPRSENGLFTSNLLEEEGPYWLSSSILYRNCYTRQQRRKKSHFQFYILPCVPESVFHTYDSSCYIAPTEDIENSNQLSQLELKRSPLRVEITNANEVSLSQGGEESDKPGDTLNPLDILDVISQTFIGNDPENLRTSLALLDRVRVSYDNIADTSPTALCGSNGAIFHVKSHSTKWQNKLYSRSTNKPILENCHSDPTNKNAAIGANGQENLLNTSQVLLRRSKVPKSKSSLVETLKMARTTAGCVGQSVNVPHSPECSEDVLDDKDEDPVYEVAQEFAKTHGYGEVVFEPAKPVKPLSAVQRAGRRAARRKQKQDPWDNGGAHKATGRLHSDPYTGDRKLAVSETHGSPNWHTRWNKNTCAHSARLRTAILKHASLYDQMAAKDEGPTHKIHSPTRAPKYSRKYSSVSPSRPMKQWQRSESGECHVSKKLHRPSKRSFSTSPTSSAGMHNHGGLIEPRHEDVEENEIIRSASLDTFCQLLKDKWNRIEADVAEGKQSKEGRTRVYKISRSIPESYLTRKTRTSKHKVSTLTLANKINPSKTLLHSEFQNNNAILRNNNIRNGSSGKYYKMAMKYSPSAVSRLLNTQTTHKTGPNVEYRLPDSQSQECSQCNDDETGAELRHKLKNSSSTTIFREMIHMSKQQHVENKRSFPAVAMELVEYHKKSLNEEMVSENTEEPSELNVVDIDDSCVKERKTRCLRYQPACSTSNYKNFPFCPKGRQAIYQGSWVLGSNEMRTASCPNLVENSLVHRRRSRKGIYHVGHTTNCINSFQKKKDNSELTMNAPGRGDNAHVTSYDTTLENWADKAKDDEHSAGSPEATSRGGYVDEKNVTRGIFDPPTTNVPCPRKERSPSRRAHSFSISPSLSLSPIKLNSNTPILVLDQNFQPTNDTDKDSDVMDTNNNSANTRSNQDRQPQCKNNNVTDNSLPSFKKWTRRSAVLMENINNNSIGENECCVWDDKCESPKKLESLSDGILIKVEDARLPDKQSEDCLEFDVASNCDHPKYTGRKTQNLNTNSNNSHGSGESESPSSTESSQKVKAIEREVLLLTGHTIKPRHPRRGDCRKNHLPNWNTSHFSSHRAREDGVRLCFNDKGGQVEFRPRRQRCLHSQQINSDSKEGNEISGPFTCSEHRLGAHRTRIHNYQSSFASPKDLKFPDTPVQNDNNPSFQYSLGHRAHQPQQCQIGENMRQKPCLKRKSDEVDNYVIPNQQGEPMYNGYQNQTYPKYFGYQDHHASSESDMELDTDPPSTMLYESLMNISESNSQESGRVLLLFRQLDMQLRQSHEHLSHRLHDISRSFHGHLERIKRSFTNYLTDNSHSMLNQRNPHQPCRRDAHASPNHCNQAENNMSHTVNYRDFNSIGEKSPHKTLHTKKVQYWDSKLGTYAPQSQVKPERMNDENATGDYTFREHSALERNSRSSAIQLKTCQTVSPKEPFGITVNQPAFINIEGQNESTHDSKINDINGNLAEQMHSISKDNTQTVFDLNTGGNSEVSLCDQRNNSSGHDSTISCESPFRRNGSRRSSGSKRNDQRKRWGLERGVMEGRQAVVSDLHPKYKSEDHTRSCRRRNYATGAFCNTCLPKQPIGQKRKRKQPRTGSTKSVKPSLQRQSKKRRVPKQSSRSKKRKKGIIKKSSNRKSSKRGQAQSTRKRRNRSQNANDFSENHKTVSKKSAVKRKRLKTTPNSSDRYSLTTSGYKTLYNMLRKKHILLQRKVEAMGLALPRDDQVSLTDSEINIMVGRFRSLIEVSDQKKLRNLRRILLSHRPLQDDRKLRGRSQYRSVKNNSASSSETIPLIKDYADSNEENVSPDFERPCCSKGYEQEATPISYNTNRPQCGTNGVRAVDSIIMNRRLLRKKRNQSKNANIDVSTEKNWPSTLNIVPLKERPPFGILNITTSPQIRANKSYSPHSSFCEDGYISFKCHDAFNNETFRKSKYLNIVYDPMILKSDTQNIIKSKENISSKMKGILNYKKALKDEVCGHQSTSSQVTEPFCVTSHQNPTQQELCGDSHYLLGDNDISMPNEHDIGCLNPNVANAFLPPKSNATTVCQFDFREIHCPKSGTFAEERSPLKMNRMTCKSSSLVDDFRGVDKNSDIEIKLAEFETLNAVSSNKHPGEPSFDKMSTEDTDPCTELGSINTCKFQNHDACPSREAKSSLSQKDSSQTIDIKPLSTAHPTLVLRHRCPVSTSERTCLVSGEKDGNVDPENSIPTFMEEKSNVTNNDGLGETTYPLPLTHNHIKGHVSSTSGKEKMFPFSLNHASAENGNIHSNEKSPIKSEIKNELPLERWKSVQPYLLVRHPGGISTNWSCFVPNVTTLISNPLGNYPKPTFKINTSSNSCKIREIEQPEISRNAKHRDNWMNIPFKSEEHGGPELGLSDGGMVEVVQERKHDEAASCELTSMDIQKESIETEPGTHFSSYHTPGTSTRKDVVTVFPTKNTNEPNLLEGTAFLKHRCGDQSLPSKLSCSSDSSVASINGCMSPIAGLPATLKHGLTRSLNSGVFSSHQGNDSHVLTDSTHSHAAQSTSSSRDKMNMSLQRIQSPPISSQNIDFTEEDESMKECQSHPEHSGLNSGENRISRVSDVVENASSSESETKTSFLSQATGRNNNAFVYIGVKRKGEHVSQSAGHDCRGDVQVPRCPRLQNHLPSTSAESDQDVKNTFTTQCGCNNDRHITTPNIDTMNIDRMSGQARSCADNEFSEEREDSRPHVGVMTSPWRNPTTTVKDALDACAHSSCKHAHANHRSKDSANEIFHLPLKRKHSIDLEPGPHTLLHSRKVPKRCYTMQHMERHSCSQEKRKLRYLLWQHRREKRFQIQMARKRMNLFSGQAWQESHDSFKKTIFPNNISSADSDDEASSP